MAVSDGRGLVLGAVGLLAAGAVVHRLRDRGLVEAQIIESRCVEGGLLLSVEHHVRPPQKKVGSRPSWTEQIAARLLRYDEEDVAYTEVGRVVAPRVERTWLTAPCARNLEELERRVGRTLGLFSVTEARLEPRLRRKRYGLAMYEAVAAAAAQAGAAVSPDACAHGYTSSSAGRVWASLGRRFPHVGSASPRRKDPVVLLAVARARGAA